MLSVLRATQLLLPTLKQPPADASAVSHQLLVRAGFIRQLGAGLYSILPLGRRSLLKLEQILREEMERAGAQEFLLPSLQPAELWRGSGRWDTIDETMFRLHDRRGGDYCLAMTHEEVFTAIARAELRSYRQLPQIWYQIGLKFRDEPRPKAGLLRVREFQMKDAYSFDLDTAGLDASFERMRSAYARIYARCDVAALPAEAFSGAMGGRESIEFVVRTSAGEDEVIHCRSCGYTANSEIARSHIVEVPDENEACIPFQSAPHSEGAGADTPQEFATPGVQTIAALAAPPYGVPADHQLKTLVYIADTQPVVVIVRGDHALKESKLQVATGAASVRPADADEIWRLMGAHAGSLGAVNFTAAPVLVDSSVATRRQMVTGANRDGFHFRSVDVHRDIVRGPTGSSGAASVADLRTAIGGEDCPSCGAPLESFAALEVGHIFKFGSRYSAPLGATVLDANGREMPLQMGSYGIGLGRLLAAVVEQHHDSDGIVWPAAMAPFTASVLCLGSEPELAEVAEQVVEILVASGIDVLYDERPERPGVKFKEADLIGIPLRIAVGRRALATHSVDWKLRTDPQSELVPIAGLAARLRTLPQDFRPRVAED